MTQQPISNLAKHRRETVAKVCQALGEAITPGAAYGTAFACDFEGEPLQAPTPAVALIVDCADDCDGLVISAWEENKTDGRKAVVVIYWGQGAGCAINDYSAWLDKTPGWQAVLDHIEFLEI